MPAAPARRSGLNSPKGGQAVRRSGGSGAQKDLCEMTLKELEQYVEDAFGIAVPTSESDRQEWRDWFDAAMMILFTTARESFGRTPLTVGIFESMSDERQADYAHLLDDWPTRAYSVLD